MPAFAAAWPRIGAALPLPTPPAAELRAAAARCCTLALRAQASAVRPAVASIAETAAAIFTLPSGHGFAAPLGVALGAFRGDACLGGALAAALDAIARAPEVAMLAAWGAGDQCPELAQARALESLPSCHPCMSCLWGQENPLVLSGQPPHASWDGIRKSLPCTVLSVTGLRSGAYAVPK